MSDQFTMQRADLAKKDKGELQTIITALGGKSSARAKKDALIDQVLELSGIKVSPAGSQQGLALDDDASAAPVAGAESAASEPTTALPSADAASSDSSTPENKPAPRNPRSSDTAQAPGKSPQRGERPRQGAGGERPPRNGDAQAERKPTAAKQSNAKQGAGQDGQGNPKGNRQKGDDSNAAGKQDGGKQAASQQAGGQQAGMRNDKTGNAKNEGPKNDGPKDNQLSDDQQGNEEEGNRKRRRRGRGRDNVAEDSQVGEFVPAVGFLDLHDSGYGFLRVDGHRQSNNDVYVAVKMARTLALRKGDLVTGTSRPAQRNEKNPALQQVESVGSLSVDEARDRPNFDELTPVHATENLIMEREGESNPTGRILDLVTPLAKGQRGLIVAPARAGKTAMITEMAKSVEANHPDATLFVVQLDERPEEVTKMRRSVPGAEVVASAFGRAADEHISAVELTMERAKRLAETGNDVVVLLDGLSRLIRAYSLAGQGGARVSASGVDAGALYAAKRCFASACKLEEGGSITIFATISGAADGSVDALVLEEFTDAANVVLTLEPRLAELSIYPAIDIARSLTRDENLLMDERSSELVRKARQSVIEPDTGDSGAPLVRLLAALDKTSSTEDFLNEFA